MTESRRRVLVIHKELIHMSIHTHLDRQIAQTGCVPVSNDRAITLDIACAISRTQSTSYWPIGRRSYYASNVFFCHTTRTRCTMHRKHRKNIQLSENRLIATRYIHSTCIANICWYHTANETEISSSSKHCSEEGQSVSQPVSQINFVTLRAS